MPKRSSTFVILLVAWRRNAIGHLARLRCLPPLSVIRIKVVPPSWISTVTAVGTCVDWHFPPALLQRKTGRSMTSPAAILSMVFLIQYTEYLRLFLLMTIFLHPTTWFSAASVLQPVNACSSASMGVDGAHIQSHLIPLEYPRRFTVSKQGHLLHDPPGHTFSSWAYSCAALACTLLP